MAIMSMMYGISGCKQSSGQKTETAEVVTEQKVTGEVVTEQKVTADETKKADIVRSAYLSTQAIWRRRHIVYGSYNY